MFYSVELLTGRHAKFGLMWRAATCGSARKLHRRAIVQVSVSDTCQEILNYVPTEKNGEADLTSKFSLYLLGQLIYGTVLIFDRQVTLFERDVISACAECKRLTMDIVLGTDEDIRGNKARKRRRQSKEILQEIDPNIDVVEEPDTRFVHVARACDITLADSEPMIWHRPDVFIDEENRQPVVLNAREFINWNELRSRMNSQESIQKVGESSQEQVTEPVILDELPPLPPPEAFENIDRETFMSNSLLNLTTGQRSDVQRAQSPAVVSKDALDGEPVVKKPRSDTDIDGDRVKSTVEENDTSGSLRPSLELIPLDKGETDEHAFLRRRIRKSLLLLDTGDLTISYESIKRMQSDYSSLVRTKEELYVDSTVGKYPTVHDLLQPYPASFKGRRFPKECRELFRSRVCDTLTYKQALTENVFEAPDQGLLSKPWRDSSHESSTESFLSAGIAFLKETPPRFLNNGDLPGPDEERNDLLTPGKITLRHTPDWYRSGMHDERLSELSLRVNDPMLNEPTQLAGDISVPENARYRESHGSYVENVRRATGGTNEFDRRPSEHLFEPARAGNISFQSSENRSGSVSLPDSLKEKCQREEYRCLLGALSNANGFIPLSSVIPPASTSRKQAAAVFSALLSFSANKVTIVEQDEPYGEIWMRFSSSSRSGDEGSQ
uniref:Rad21_Rec8_N domain-containing protein n=1 Tax=Haemonchus contortus TaxID=6289 RepID=A0A7I4Y5T2_HAECO